MVMSRWSVDLTTLFPGQFILRLKIKQNDWLLADTSLRLYSSFITPEASTLCNTFPCNLPQPFLNKQKGEND